MQLRKISLSNQSMAIGHSRPSNHTLHLTRRSGFEIAGIFILLALLAVIGSVSNGSAANHQNSGQNKPVTVDVTHQASSSPPEASQTLSTSDSSAAFPSSSGVSSTVTTNTSNGQTSTSISVNGKNVNVPANGSTSQTVNTPDGPVNVSASNSQSGTGSNFNSSISSTGVNDYSSTYSNFSTTGGSQ